MIRRKMMTVKEQVLNYTDEMLENIARLVKYDSVQGEAKPGMPFGEGPANVLAEALKIAEEMGFKTVNLDNYCGYAEIGEGEDIIGIAGHLDIVPVGDGWTYDPFKLTIVGDRAYGRGSTDDKGPVIMALYAMRILRDSGVKLNKRIRLIMGCNEETGSLCMKHYTEVEERVTLGFTPDASYPCIYGEKGLMAMTAYSKKTKIISMNGGFVTNAVCHRCTTVIPAGEVTAKSVTKALSETALKSFDVKEKDGKITIYAEGESAHASWPLLGVNAAGCTMQALAAAGFEDDFVEFYNSHIGTACDGSGVGLALSDEYGELTLNNGIVSTNDGVISCTIDVRIPVTYNEAQIREAAAPYLEDEKGRIEIVNIVKSLFCPRESELVNALYSAYVDVTGDTKNEPLVIGGGTYAKSLPGIIAFGPEFPDKDYRIHNADEFLEISGMQSSTEIYVKAIENLLEI